MKLLFIDCFCPHGHINLNKKYVELFSKKNYHVDYILKKGYAEEIGVDKRFLLWEPSSFYFKEDVGKFKSRYQIWKLLVLVNWKYNLNSYDYIFFSSFDEISLFFSGIRKKLILVNHANIANFDNPVKRFFLKAFTKSAIFVVFHKFIKNRSLDLGVKKVHVEPIGLLDPYLLPNNSNNFLISIDPKLNSDNQYQIIFAPSGSKYNDLFLSLLICNQNFLDFLSLNSIILVIKDKTLISNHKNIAIIKQHLTDDQYRSLFLNSLCILLCYPKSFSFRVSAVMYECFSNNKPSLLFDIEGFRAFEEYFNYPHLFNNSEGLIERITHLIKLQNGIKWYNGIKKLNPEFDWLV
jgi:hypothetical protein